MSRDESNDTVNVFFDEEEKETALAKLFLYDTEATWIPKSLIREQYDHGDFIIVSVPRWFAEQEELEHEED